MFYLILPGLFCSAFFYLLFMILLNCVFVLVTFPMLYCSWFFFFYNHTHTHDSNTHTEPETLDRISNAQLRRPQSTTLTYILPWQTAMCGRFSTLAVAINRRLCGISLWPLCWCVCVYLLSN